MKLPAHILFAVILSGRLATTMTMSVAEKDQRELKELVALNVAKDYASLATFYTDLHLHPELPLMEEKTSAKVAAGLRAAGFAVTEKFGGYGIVARSAGEE